MLQLTLADSALPGAGSEALGSWQPLILVQETQQTTGETALTGEEDAGAHGTAATTEEQADAGMPQLDIGDYTPQLVWLAITFCLLLVLMWRVALPRVAEVLDQREQRIQNDLDKAERLKSDADEALAAYRKTVADARAKAQLQMRETTAAVAAETAKREAAFAAQLAERTKAAEDGIAAAKARAMTDIAGVSADVASSILAKVAGLSIPAAELRSAVKSTLEERS